jgi:hypothetical protein
MTTWEWSLPSDRLRSWWFRDSGLVVLLLLAARIMALFGAIGADRIGLGVVGRSSSERLPSPSMQKSAPREANSTARTDSMDSSALIRPSVKTSSMALLRFGLARSTCRSSPRTVLVTRIASEDNVFAVG